MLSPGSDVAERLFPSDPDVPPLALVRVGDSLQIRLPDCAKGDQQKVFVQGEPSPEDPEPPTYWEVKRPWPAADPTGGLSIVVGKVTSDMQVIHPYAQVPAGFPVWIGVSTDEMT